MDKRKIHVVPLNLKFVLRQGDPMLACGIDWCVTLDQATCGGNANNQCTNSDVAACGSLANTDSCQIDWGASCTQAGGVDQCTYDSNGSCPGQNDFCGWD